MSQSTAVGSAFTTDARALKTQMSQGKSFLITPFFLTYHFFNFCYLGGCQKCNQTTQFCHENILKQQQQKNPLWISDL